MHALTPTLPLPQDLDNVDRDEYMMPTVSRGGNVTWSRVQSARLDWMW